MRLVIGSAPCQAFSMAGLGAGREVLPTLADAAWRHLEGKPPSAVELDELCDDPRAHLVLEPLRWALALRPEMVALEQVKPVLPLWEAFGQVLRTVGYRTWAGVVSAETFGTPQTRERAILVCSRSRQPCEPRRTHQRYVAPRRREVQEESLFDVPDAERIVLPEDRELLPWVSMAEALGWHGAVYANGTHDHRAERPMSEPAPTVMFGERLNTVAWHPADRVGFPRLADTPSNRSNGSVEIDGTDYRARDFRDASEPAFTVTEKARSAIRLRHGSNENASVREADEPAATVRFGHDAKPAPAITAKLGGQAQWVSERLATTVACDPRVHPPGHKENADDEPGRFEQRRGENAVRVTVEEASVLQGFPADYPWQGNRTARYAQIGNAIPPQMALAVLKGLVEG